MGPTSAFIGAPSRAFLARYVTCSFERRGSPRCRRCIGLISSSGEICRGSCDGPERQTPTARAFFVTLSLLLKRNNFVIVAVTSYRNGDGKAGRRFVPFAPAATKIF